MECDRKKENLNDFYLDASVRCCTPFYSYTQRAAAATEQTQMMSNMFGPLKMELGGSWIKFESDKITTIIITIKMRHKKKKKEKDEEEGDQQLE